MPDDLLQPPVWYTDGQPCRFCELLLFKDPEERAKHELLCRTVKNLDPTGKPIREYRKKAVKTVGEILFTGGTKEDPYDMSAVLALFEGEGEGSEKKTVQKMSKKELEAAERKKKKEKKKRQEEKRKEREKRKEEKKKMMIKKEASDDKGKGILVVSSDTESDNEQQQLDEKQKVSESEIPDEEQPVDIIQIKIKMMSEFANISPEAAYDLLKTHGFDLDKALLAYTQK